MTRRGSTFTKIHVLGRVQKTHNMQGSPRQKIIRYFGVGLGTPWARAWGGPYIIITCVLIKKRITHTSSVFGIWNSPNEVYRKSGNGYPTDIPCNAVTQPVRGFYIFLSQPLGRATHERGAEIGIYRNPGRAESSGHCGVGTGHAGSLWGLRRVIQVVRRNRRMWKRKRRGTQEAETKTWQ